MKWFTPLLPYLAVAIGIFWFQNAWAALLGFHCAIILALLLVRSNVPVKFVFKSRDIRWVALSILLSGSGGIVLYFFWTSFGIASNLSTHTEALGLNASGWPAFIAYLSFVNPFIEEYFWRGALGSPTKTPHVSDFFYAGFHALVLLGIVPAGSIVFGLAMLALAGWFWRQIARQDGGLLAPVLGHMAVDFTILVVIYRMSV